MAVQTEETTKKKASRPSRACVATFILTAFGGAREKRGRKGPPAFIFAD
jgi:hypothetical protein